MYLVIRRRIAVPRDASAPFVVEVSGSSPFIPLADLMRALSFDARKDGQEGSDVLLQVTDGAL